jgi:hypothetical protein
MVLSIEGYDPAQNCRELTIRHPNIRSDPVREFLRNGGSTANVLAIRLPNSWLDEPGRLGIAHVQ